MDIRASNDRGCKKQLLPHSPSLPPSEDPHILSSLESLQNPLSAFTPPHHQGGHEQGDQHRHGDERGEDAGRRLVQEPAGQSAVAEEVAVNLHEEAVDHLIGPEAVHPRGHLVSAVCQPLIDPAKGHKRQSNPPKRLNQGEPENRSLQNEY